MLKVGQQVVQNFPDLGRVHGVIVDKTDEIQGHGVYTVRLTPQGYIEETILAGLLAYNEKSGVDFWSIKKLDDNAVVSHSVFDYMLYMEGPQCQ